MELPRQRNLRQNKDRGVEDGSLGQVIYFLILFPLTCKGWKW